MIEADAVVVGGGPAGAAFALNLAPRWRVLVLDRREAPGPRIGESLVPAARRLLTDMGLWQAFLEQGHQPHYGTTSIWGSGAPTERTDLRDLDASGWHLDRARFDCWLRRAAEQRGAAMLTSARLGSVVRDNEMWRCQLHIEHRRIPVRCRLVIDASGRGASVARGFGARRAVEDRLVCGWMHGRDLEERQSGLTHIEAVADGWWYTAPLPGNRRVVAFHTDADLPPAAIAAVGGQALLRHLSERSLLGSVLAASGFVADGARGFCAAHGANLDAATGDGWLAVGDAALSFDPLSSQGLLNALYTGLAGAEAADRALRGDDGALAEYQAKLSALHIAYRGHLRAWYGLERRWAEQPFWQRRSPPASARA